MRFLKGILKTFFSQLLIPCRLRNIDAAWSGVASYIKQAINTAKASQELDQAATGASINILDRLASFVVGSDKGSMSDEEVVSD
jgi:hypothetical protein